jgi:hypothetical protein
METEVVSALIGAAVGGALGILGSVAALKFQERRAEQKSARLLSAHIQAIIRCCDKVLAEWEARPRTGGRSGEPHSIILGSEDMERLLTGLSRTLLENHELFMLGEDSTLHQSMFDFYLKVEDFTSRLRGEREREVGRSHHLGTQWYESLKADAIRLKRNLDNLGTMLPL